MSVVGKHVDVCFRPCQKSRCAADAGLPSAPLDPQSRQLLRPLPPGPVLSGVDPLRHSPAPLNLLLVGSCPNLAGKDAKRLSRRQQIDPTTLPRIAGKRDTQRNAPESQDTHARVALRSHKDSRISALLSRVFSLRQPCQRVPTLGIRGRDTWNPRARCFPATYGLTCFHWSTS